MTVECGRVDCVGDTDSQLLNLSNSLHSAEDMEITPRTKYICVYSCQHAHLLLSGLKTFNVSSLKKEF